MIDIKIKIDQGKVAKDMLKEIKVLINRSIPNIRTTLNKEIEKIVFNRLVAGVPTISGRDLYEIGVPDINNRIMSIVRIASQSIEVKVSPGNLLRIDIGILRQDYSDLLSLPESVFVYTSGRGSGVLEWLKWLLIEGGGSVIGGFDFSPIPSNFSRTGGGVMVSGGSWNVPSSLAGTAQNNILTRSLDNIQKDLELILKRELQRVIK